MKESNNKRIYLIAYIVVVLVIGAIFLVLVVGRCATREVLDGNNETLPTEYVADDVFLDLMNGDNAEIMDKNGSSAELLNSAGVFINAYLMALSEGDFEKAYGMYAVGVVEKKGYTYTYEKFCENSASFLEMVEVEPGMSVLKAHYSGCIESDNFVTVTLVIGRKLNGEYDNSVAAEYTLVKVEGGYELLDFPYADFDLYSYLFVDSEAVGLPEVETFVE